MGNARAGSDGEGLQGRTRLFRRRENRDAFVSQPHQILVPSWLHGLRATARWLMRFCGPEKDPMNSLGTMRKLRVNLYGQRIDIGVCNHRVEDGQIDAPWIVKTVS